ncbi:hypothetical protein ABT263_12310 [Kitasatospora sp. NPDC001603]|uniref:hypothetical protein n=1 Tax=Kitasatospora sp. NPDC001603 TaxID=3154388 RepID=UPI003325479C
MTIVQLSPPTPFTRAQRELQACIRCGGEDGELVPDGHRYTATGSATSPLGWAVVAHPACRTAVPEEEQ